MTTLVNTRIPSVQVNIRSDDVEVTADPTRSDLTCRFNRPIQIPAGIKTLVTLVSAQIPNSFYSIPTDTQITFSLATSGSVTVTMSAGTYSISEWNTKLNTLLTQSDAPTFSVVRTSLKEQVLSPPGAWQVTAISANSGQVLRMFGEDALPFGSGTDWTSKNIPGTSYLAAVGKLPKFYLDPNFQDLPRRREFWRIFYSTLGGKIWALPKFPAANPTCKPTSPPGILADPKFYLGVRTFHG